MDKKRLTAVILLSLSLGLAFQPTTWAMDTVTIDYQGKPALELNYYNEGENSGALQEAISDISEYNFTPALKEGVNSAAQYWVDILGANAKNSSPWQLMVFGKEKHANAYARSIAFLLEDEECTMDSITYLEQVLQKGAANNYIDMSVAAPELEADSAPFVIGTVCLGENLGAIGKSGSVNKGWYINNETLLCQNEQEADLLGTSRHELGHALGIGKTVENEDTSSALFEDPQCSDFKNYLEENKNSVYFHFPTDEELLNNSYWYSHLYDQNGKQAQAGMLIVTNAMLKSLEGSAYSRDNCFVLEDVSDESGLSVKDIAKLREEQPTYGYAFFKGKNVSQVLEGKTFQGVDGLPISGWENNPAFGTTFPELSHIQLPVLMSHRSYCSYTTFTEVELAVMQDLGYELDRKAYYGRSIYNDNQNIVNTQGYFARNREGTEYLEGIYSDISLGLGLHVYGSHNEITQAADLLTRGVGSVGIRVDGVGNTINIAENTEIHADGKNGVGIMVAYGKNHVINQTGTITALGENGRAAQFDFGSSSNGAIDEYRGSYIRYLRGVDENTGAINYAINDPIKMEDVNYYCSEPDELNGALVKEYNIMGSLKGSQNAIYIGKNAFVKNINLLSNAELSGDITSDWKHFSEEEGIYSTNVSTDTSSISNLLIQYNGDNTNYTKYIPDLVTQLNVLPGAGNSIAYKDRIVGSDNIRLNVIDGTFNFNGSADILGVSVAKEARLLGGSYTLQDMSAKLYKKDIEDSNASGKFINAGTIGAVLPTSSNTAMTINGDLVLQNNSSVQFTGNVLQDTPLTGVVAVDGKVTQEGTVNVTVDSNGKYLPGSYSVLLEKGTDVALNVADSSASIYEQGLLQAVYDTDTKNIVFSTKATDKLNGDQNKAVAALTDAFSVNSASYKGLSYLEKERYVTLLNTSEEGLIQRATKELTSNNNAQLAQAVQQSNLIGRMVTARLASVNAKTVSVPVKVAPKSLVENKDAEKQAVVVKVEVPVEKENGSWGKLDKGWGKAGSVNSHSSAMIFGYDKKYNAYNRAGVILSYADSSAATTAKHDKTKDYRLGLYNGYHKGANEVAVYVDYGHQRHTAKGSTYLNPSYRNDYNSRVLELGAEYKYDLHSKAAKLFRVSPYANAQVSRMWQDGYREGALGQNVHKHAGNYCATELGLEVARQLKQGSYSARLGYKEVWDGASTRLNYSIGTVDFVSESRLDKHFVTASLNGSAKLQHGWFLEGEARLEKGAHDRSYGVAAMLKYEW